MSSEQPEFVDGLIVKPPHAKAPDFVKASLSIKREALIAWLQGRDGEWVNLDVKESRNGKWYASVNDWKPKEGNQERARPAPEPDNGSFYGDKASSNAFEDDSIPF